MARKRVIYQSEALFVSSTGTADANNDYAFNHANDALQNHETGVQIMRVQEANYSFDMNRTDVNQFGNLAAIDRVILEQPTVSLDFSYYVQSGENERQLGFNTDGQTSAIKNFLNATADVKNYYIYVEGEGDDASNGTTGTAKCIGLGNGTLTNYTLDAAVGDMPTASLTAECFNMTFYDACTGTKPSIKVTDGTIQGGHFRLPQPESGDGYSCLRHGDIHATVSGTKGLVTGDLKLQNFSFGLGLDREPIQRLGTRFNFSREIVFPITPTLSFDAIMGDIEAGDLADLVNTNDPEFDLMIRMNKPEAGAAYVEEAFTNNALSIHFKGAKLDSQSFTSNIGDNKTVSLGFSTQVGGTGDLVHNVLMFAPDGVNTKFV